MMTCFFLWTTLQCSMPGNRSLYARAPSVCNTTLRCWRRGFPILLHSVLRIGPGPGAFCLVAGGFKRNNRSEDGLPRSTMPHHCSHFIFWPSMSGSSRRALPRSTSSASTSFQIVPDGAPKVMDFSLCSTNLVLASSKFVKMRSMGLWSTSKMRCVVTADAPATAE